MNRVNFKKRIFDIIQIGNKDDIPSRIFDVFIVIVISVNILSMFLETFERFARFLSVFKMMELVTVGIFCVEYALRIWTADILYPNRSKWGARLRFLYSYDGIIDLLTILPFFFLSGFVVFRMLRVVRIFHLFRLNAQYDSFNVITTVLYEKRNAIISSVFIILVLMLASSLGVYSAEHEVQPEAFRNAFSGIWWSVATLLTVGYGDIYPITIMGRIMGIITAFLGVGVVAIPTGIISAGFVEYYTRTKNSEHKLMDIEEIGEISIDADNPFVGMTVEQVFDEYAARILVIIRADMTVIATSNIEIQANDILVLQSPQVTKKQ
jgi:voltage-gated potassium channel